MCGDTSGSHTSVTQFGRSGDIDDIYRHHGLDTGSSVRGALDLMP
jgi:pyruvate dehydrogenase E1 component